MINFLENIGIWYVIEYKDFDWIASQFIEAILSSLLSLPSLVAISTMTLWFAFPSKKALEKSEQEAYPDFQPIEDLTADIIVEQASEAPTAETDSNV